MVHQGTSPPSSLLRSGPEAVFEGNNQTPLAQQGNSSSVIYVKALRKGRKSPASSKAPRESPKSNKLNAIAIGGEEVPYPSSDEMPPEQGGNPVGNTSPPEESGPPNGVQEQGASVGNTSAPEESGQEEDISSSAQSAQKSRLHAEKMDKRHAMNVERIAKTKRKSSAKL